MQFWNEPDDGSGGGEPDVTPSAAPSIDYSRMAQEFAGAVAPHLKPEPVQQTMTAEEARRALNYWEPDDNWYQQFDSLEQRKSAIAAMRDGLTNQHVTITRAMLKEMREQFENEFKPMRELVSQQQQRQAEERFHSSYPELADPAYRPLIGAITQQLQQQNAFAGKTESQAYELVATEAAKVFQKQNPNFQLGKTKSTSTGGGGSIPVTTPGGGGGGGNSGDDGNGSKRPRAVGFLPRIKS